MADFGKAGGKADAPTKSEMDNVTPKVGFSEPPSQQVTTGETPTGFAGTTPPAR